MHILQIGKYLPPVPGGIETAVFELCLGLAEKPAIDVSCLVSNTTAHTVHENFGKIRVTRSGRLMALASTPICPGFKKTEFVNEADLLHFHLPNPLATFAFPKPDRPYVVTYHCDILRYKPLYKLYEVSMTKFLEGARAIVVPSKELLATSTTLQKFRRKCVVIPLAIDTGHLELSAAAAAKRDSLIASNPGIVLFVGRLVKYKGLDVLIRAMKGLSGKLIIVGEGPMKNELMDLAEELKISGQVEFTGFVPKEFLGSYYEAASIVALTSVDSREAFGMCLLEGLACGKALLTSKLDTGLVSVNINGWTGLHAATGDVADTNRKLAKLLADRELREKLGRNGRRHFDENFTRERMIEAHLRVYENALNSGSARP